MKRTVIHLAVVLATAISQQGCGKGTPAPPPHLNLTNGELDFANHKIGVQKADGFVVEFHPAEGDAKGKKITGRVMDGSFSMQTEEDGKTIPGVPEGDYIVTIKPNLEGAALISKNYSDPHKSELKAHIEKGINKLSTYELTK